jgi:hypothetical protein
MFVLPYDWGGFLFRKECYQCGLLPLDILGSMENLKKYQQVADLAQHRI